MSLIPRVLELEPRFSVVFFCCRGSAWGDVPGSGCATYSRGFLGTNCYFGAAKGVCQTLLGWEPALGSLQPPRAATGAVCSWELCAAGTRVGGSKASVPTLLGCLIILGSKFGRVSV